MSGEQNSTYVQEFESAWHSIVGGSLAGMAGILVGQPFDTIRVYQQTKPWIKGPFQCYGLIVRTEGHLALFKGLVPPLLGGGLLNSALFGLYESTSHSFSVYNKQHTNDGTLSTLQVFLAGMVAGAGATLIATPMELIKTQLQVQIDSKKKAATGSIGQRYLKISMPVVIHSPRPPPSVTSTSLRSTSTTPTTSTTQHTTPPTTKTKASGRYASTWDCLKKVVRTHGIMSLFMAILPCAWRDFFGYAVYFTVYERVKTLLIPPDDTSSGTNSNAITSSWLAPVYLLFAGGVAGSAGWMTVYPFDVVKSRMQAQALLHPDLHPVTGTRKLMTMRQCTIAMYREGGFRIFTVGLGTTVARAFPMDAATFLVYEAFSRLVSSS
eukprot:TRINITY_DN16310_c0_g1_i1.p1 TRINITY_DN16310_c0_g1~~TRINITY_DN16310_c0_g1_i1.p1  ORF type:complete len:380 (+),score=44.05 TRINITY_DN16310_c0_g1_i1:3-1142(+)